MNYKNLNVEQTQTFLKSVDACSEARTFAEGKTLSVAYLTCGRASWMEWLFKCVRYQTDGTGTGRVR
jgi:hypothetical protein